jgi:multiple antibiotic resistance protein
MSVETADLGAFLQATIALIAIANPFAALPVFLSLVPSGDAAGQRQAANRVALAVLAILVGAVLVGRFVLQFFGISFAAFRVGGGLVVTLTGLDMLRRRQATSQDDPAAELSAADQLIVPVAMPLIAGPGTIITAMTMAARTTGAGLPWLVLIAVVVVTGFVWLVLALSGWVQRRIGTRGQAIVIRFMGLVLVAVGAQLVLGGIADFFGLAAAYRLTAAATGGAAS